MLCRPVLCNRCVARPHQVCRKVLVTFPANKQKCLLSLCKNTVDNPPPQYSQQIIEGLRPEDLFLFREITSIMEEIGGFQTADFFLRSILFFTFFVLLLTLSVAVCRRIQQIFKVCRSLKKVAEHYCRPIGSMICTLTVKHWMRERFRSHNRKKFEQKRFREKKSLFKS